MEGNSKTETNETQDTDGGSGSMTTEMVESCLSVTKEVEGFNLANLIKADTTKLLNMTTMLEHAKELDSFDWGELEFNVNELKKRLTDNKLRAVSNNMFDYIETHDAVEKVAKLKQDGKDFEADLLSAAYITQAAPSRENEVVKMMSKKYSCLNCGSRKQQSKMNIFSRNYTNTQTVSTKASGFQCLECGIIDYGEALDSGFFQRSAFKRSKTTHNNNDSVSKTNGSSMRSHLHNHIDVLIGAEALNCIAKPLHITEEIEIIRAKYNKKVQNMLCDIGSNETQIPIEHSPRAIDILRSVILERSDDFEISCGWNKCLPLLSDYIFGSKLGAKSLKRNFNNQSELVEILYRIGDEYVSLFLEFIALIHSGKFSFTFFEEIEETAKRKAVGVRKTPIANFKKLASRKSNLLFEYIIFQMLYIVIKNFPSLEDEINIVLDRVPRLRTVDTVANYEQFFQNFVHKFINNPGIAKTTVPKFQWIHTRYFLGDYKSAVSKIINKT